MNKLTVNETMKCLNISRQSVMKRLANDSFPNAQKDDLTGWWLIPVDDVENVRQELVKRHEKQLNKLKTPAIEFVDSD